MLFFFLEGVGGGGASLIIFVHTEGRVSVWDLHAKTCAQVGIIMMKPGPRVAAVDPGGPAAKR